MLARGRSSDSVGRAHALGAGVSLVALAVAAAARSELAARLAPSFGGLARSPRFSLAATFGVLTSLGLVLLVGRGRLAGRAAVVASLTTLGWLPLVGLGVLLDHEPIVRAMGMVRASGAQPGIGGEKGAMLFLALLGAPPLVWGSCAFAVKASAPAADRVVRVAAWASVALLAIVTSSALGRVRRPDADGYLASLPVVTTLDFGDTFLLGDGTSLTYRDGRAKSPTWRTCWLEGVRHGSFAMGECTPLTVRRDALHGLWIVDDGASRFAFQEARREARDVWPSELAPFIAPPIGWTVGGVVGLALALLLLTHAVRSRRRAAKELGVEGKVGVDGWVRVPGLLPIHLAERLSPGPVVVRLAGSMGRSYREAGGASVVSWRRGTLADAAAEIAGRWMAWYALSITSGLLCAAPLLLSGLLSLLGGAR